MFLESPIEEVTDALYGKWRNFMMTHNLELKMPEMLFDGATFRITPRAIEGDGALMKFEMIPKGIEENDSQGRLFGLKKLSKKIHFFKSKCTNPLQLSVQVIETHFPSIINILNSQAQWTFFYDDNKNVSLKFI